MLRKLLKKPFQETFLQMKICKKFSIKKTKISKQISVKKPINKKLNEIFNKKKFYK